MYLIDDRGALVGGCVDLLRPVDSRAVEGLVERVPAVDHVHHVVVHGLELVLQRVSLPSVHRLA